MLQTYDALIPLMKKHCNNNESNKSTNSNNNSNNQKNRNNQINKVAADLVQLTNIFDNESQSKLHSEAIVAFHFDDLLSAITATDAFNNGYN